MSRVVVCVPWRPAPDRDAVWKYVRAHFEQFGEVVTGDTDAPVFHMAAASNAAVRATGDDWDVLVYTGADCVVGEPRQVWEAIDLAADGAFVAAHDNVHRLTRESTEAVIAWGRAPMEADPVEWTEGRSWEGVRTVGRDLWEQFGGFDERFMSGEGIAFSWSCGTLAWDKQLRTKGTLYHLWHEPRWTPDELEDVRESRGTLIRRYRDAAGDRDAIRALLRESAEARS